MNDFGKSLETIQRLLKIATEITMLKVNKERPTPETISTARSYCKEIAAANLYPFNPAACDDDLINQILDFASKVNG